MSRWLLTLALVLLAGPAFGNQQVEAGDLILHYSAIPSLDLQPEVARQYRLTRSAGRVLLSLAVQRRGADGTTVAVPATIGASVSNQLGQRQALQPREVREGEAIYYLAEVRASDGDMLDFDVSAQVDGSPRPVAVRFRQPYFVPLPH